MTQFDLSSSNYSETDSANSNPGAAGWAIGQAPSNVGAAGRAFMGSVKRAYDWDHGGTWAVVTGTANAIVITYPVAPSAYVQGQKHAFKATAANTGATTVNINSLGAKNIYQRTPTGPAALVGGEIQVGDIVELAYDGTEFVLLTPAAGLFLPAGMGPIPYAGSSAPAGWLLCYGQPISRTTYAALFAAIGTTYGAGDGSTTFNIPDMRGRVAAGVDNMGGSAANRITSGNSGITGSTLGAAGGDERMQQHLHPITDPGHQPVIPTGNPAGSGGYWAESGTFAGNSTLPTVFTGITQTNNTGSGNSQNVQPTIMMNYIIKT